MKRELLDRAWKIRSNYMVKANKLNAEGSELQTKGWKLRAEGDKLYAKGCRLQAKGWEFWTEGNRLNTEGDRIWEEAVLKTYGNIKIEWRKCHNDKKSYECHLENGEIFIP